MNHTREHSCQRPIAMRSVTGVALAQFRSMCQLAVERALSKTHPRAARPGAMETVLG